MEISEGAARVFNIYPVHAQARKASVNAIEDRLTEANVHKIRKQVVKKTRVVHKRHGEKVLYNGQSNSMSYIEFELYTVFCRNSS